MVWITHFNCYKTNTYIFTSFSVFRSGANQHFYVADSRITIFSISQRDLKPRSLSLSMNHYQLFYHRKRKAPKGQPGLTICSIFWPLFLSYEGWKQPEWPLSLSCEPLKNSKHWRIININNWLPISISKPRTPTPTYILPISNYLQKNI